MTVKRDVCIYKYGVRALGKLRCVNERAAGKENERNPKMNISFLFPFAVAALTDEISPKRYFNFVGTESNRTVLVYMQPVCGHTYILHVRCTLNAHTYNPAIGNSRRGAQTPCGFVQRALFHFHFGASVPRRERGVRIVEDGFCEL